VALARIPPLGARALGAPSDGPELPIGLLELQRRLQLREERGEESPSWALRERYRALLWNTDRLVQLTLLLTLHEPDRPTPVCAVAVPMGWSVAAASALAASVALAAAQLRYSYPVSATLSLELPPDIPAAAVRAALAPLRRAAEAERIGRSRAMPMAEIGLVAAGVLP